MAQKKHVVLIDDIDGTSASETVRFSLDGADYEVDLNGAHAEALRESFAEWIGHARKVSGGKRANTRQRTASAVPSKSADSTAKVRQWARQNGHTVSDRGRIPSRFATPTNSRTDSPAPGRSSKR